MLLGERLGRRHQRALEAVLDRAQHRVQRDDGLARADLAHQQPLHRRARGEVARRSPSIAALLVAGQRERQHARPASARSARAADRARRAGALGLRLAAGAAARAAPAAAPRTPAGGGPAPGLRRAAGSATAAQRRCGGRAAARGPRSAAGSGSSTSADRGRVRPDERQDLGRGEPVGGRVVRDGVARRPLASAGRRVALDAEAVARLELAVQDQPRPGRVLLDQPRLVEERRPSSRRCRRRRSPRPAAASRAGGPGARRCSAPRRRPSRSRRGPARRPRAPRGGRAGRCSSRSPTVCRPSAAAALLGLRALHGQRRVQPRRARIADRRGEQLVSASSLGELAERRRRSSRALMMTAAAVGPPIKPGLLGREQPPVARLAAVRELELDLAGGQRLHGVVVERRARRRAGR